MLGGRQASGLFVPRGRCDIFAVAAKNLATALLKSVDLFLRQGWNIFCENVNVPVRRIAPIRQRRQIADARVRNVNVMQFDR